MVTPPRVEQFKDAAAEDALAQLPAPPPVPPDADDGAMTRINLRLSQHLKSRIEEAAGREGLSANAWPVRAAAAALQSHYKRRHHLELNR